MTLEDKARALVEEISRTTVLSREEAEGALRRYDGDANKFWSAYRTWVSSGAWLPKELV